MPGGRGPELNRRAPQAAAAQPDPTRPMALPAREPRDLPGARLQVVAHEPAESNVEPNIEDQRYHQEARDRLLSLRRDLEARLHTLTDAGRENRSTMQRLHDAWQRAKAWLEIAKDQAKELRGTIVHLEQLSLRLDAATTEQVRGELLPYIQNLAETAREKFRVEPPPASETRAQEELELPHFTEQDWDFFNRGEAYSMVREMEIRARQANFDRDADHAVHFDKAVDDFVHAPDAGEAPPVHDVAVGDFAPEAPPVAEAPVGTKPEISVDPKSEATRAFLTTVNALFEGNTEAREAATQALLDRPIHIHNVDYRVVGVLCRGGVGIAMHVFNEQTGQEAVLKLTKPNSRAKMTVQDGGFSVRSQLLEVAALYRLTKGARREMRRKQQPEPEQLPVAEMIDALQISDPTNRDLVSTVLVMEKVKGKMFHDQLQNQESSFSDSPKTLQSLVAAVRYMHEQGVYHRDLKPANVMVQPDGSVKLIDMGMALIPELVDRQLRGVAKVPVAEPLKVVDPSVVPEGVDAPASPAPLRVDLPRNRWVRSTHMPNPGEAPAVYALPEVGTVIGTPSHMPDCELVGDINDEMQPLLENPTDPAAVTARLAEVARRRDLYAVGRMINRVARQLHTKAVTLPEQRMVSVLAWVSSRVINEYEFAESGQDQIGLEEVARVLADLDGYSTWQETQTVQGQELYRTVNEYLMEKQARLQDWRNMTKFIPRRKFEYVRPPVAEDDDDIVVLDESHRVGQSLAPESANATWNALAANDPPAEADDGGTRWVGEA